MKTKAPMSTCKIQANNDQQNEEKEMCLSPSDRQSRTLDISDISNSYEGQN